MLFGSCIHGKFNITNLKYLPARLLGRHIAYMWRHNFHGNNLLFGVSFTKEFLLVNIRSTWFWTQNFLINTNIDSCYVPQVDTCSIMLCSLCSMFLGNCRSKLHIGNKMSNSRSIVFTSVYMYIHVMIRHWPAYQIWITLIIGIVACCPIDIYPVYSTHLVGHNLDII